MDFEPFIVGVLRLDYISGSFSSESLHSFNILLPLLFKFVLLLYFNFNLLLCKVSSGSSNKESSKLTRILEDLLCSRSMAFVQRSLLLCNAFIESYHFLAVVNTSLRMEALIFAIFANLSARIFFFLMNIVFKLDVSCSYRRPRSIKIRQYFGVL